MATMNFTARSIEGLKPGTKREEFWDESFRGFAIRVSPEGRKTWGFNYRIGARKRRLTIGTYPALSLADARQRALQAQHAVAMGNDPAAQKRCERHADTFGDLVEEYIERHAKAKKRSWKEDQRILTREFLPKWKHAKAKAISRREVMAVLDSIVERDSPILANKALAVVRKAYNFGIQRDIVEVNPCWGVSAPAKAKTRDRVLSREELSIFLEIIRGEKVSVGGFYELLLLTAQRSGELGRAEWKEIDLSGGWWVIPADKTKNGHPHRVPLSSRAVYLLRLLKLNSRGSRWVFPNHSGDGYIVERKRRLNSIRSRAGFEFRPHDLRRTAASLMTGLGLPRLTVSKILNHADSSVTSIYDRYSYDAEKRNALTLWSEHVEHVAAHPKSPISEEAKEITH